MITDEELAQLPDDPELAFVEFERIMRARLDEQENMAECGEYSAEPYQLEYMIKVRAAAKEYSIEALKDWRVPPVPEDIAGACRSFIADVDSYTTTIRIRQAPRNRRNSVGLDGNTKTKIHHHIEQIRSAIEQADLPEPKRDSLFKKLHVFALEVDKSRTSLDAGMAIYIAICDGIGQGFNKLEPARRFIDSIAALLGRAKDVEDSQRPSLPSPRERKRIDAPRKLLEPPAGPQWSPDDDEIPF
jgi:hypothetical protein